MPSPGGKHKCYTPSQGTNRGKNSQNMTTSKWECRLWREINNLPIHSSLIERVLSIFRQKMNGLSPSGIDMQVFFPTPTFCLRTEKVYTKIGETLKIFFVWKERKKLQNAWLEYKNFNFEKK